ncbi:MAG: hypothetical protein OEZ01_05905 [Candidatus Heimdallarchaeota archaeon]|nr:hypothetical protein [Candidatus Heimdallarchaeota archaeon]MDH5645520.1 hypothetical protein [Candidatus Heimdallarchaeota archaeon]
MVELNVTIGKTKTIELEVTKERTALHIGSGSIGVLSTPSMIASMEKASALNAQEDLPEGYTTVGTVVCITHNKAVKQGETVQAISEIKSQDRRKIEFAVKVLYKGELVGEGKHERFIINEENFLSKLP